MDGAKLRYNSNDRQKCKEVSEDVCTNLKWLPTLLQKLLKTALKIHKHMQASIADVHMMIPGFGIISEVLAVRISHSLWKGPLPSLGALG